jgi:tRNA nucleotidyltransferase/poly(A) polymerase
MRPVLFAITVEKPGGVVVSKRKRIVVTAVLTEDEFRRDLTVDA